MEEEKLGKYRLLSLLATGGMGEVFLARQEGPAGFSKTVVVKRILRHLASDQGFIDMFLNEARLAAQLQHPNIVQIFGLEHEDDTYFIAMEHVHGRSLRSCLDAAGHKGLVFPPAIAARICEQALLGLQFAHRLGDPEGRPLGVLHRDVSPENVLVSFSGQVKLVDFGIAKAMRESTVTGLLKGKLGYMAPEQFVRGATIDARIDVFAAGVLLHELLLNALPAQTPKSPDEAMQPRPKFVARPELPEALNALLQKALEPDPNQRFASAQAFAEALETYLTQSGEPSGPTQIGKFLEQLFGREKVRTNPGITLGDPEAGPARTAVLKVPDGAHAVEVSPEAESMLAGSPTMIEPAMQLPAAQGSTEPPSSSFSLPTTESAEVFQPPVVTGTLLPGRRRTVAFVGVGVLAALLALGVIVFGRSPSKPQPQETTGIVEDLTALPPEDVDAGAAKASNDSSDDDPAPPVRRRPPQRGKVTVRVNPWAEVFFGGKSYGITPLKRPVDVPAGAAVFVLKNSQLNVIRRVTVRVPAGGDVVLKADLFKK